MSEIQTPAERLTDIWECIAGSGGMSSLDRASVFWLCAQLEAAWKTNEELADLSPPPGSELALMTEKAENLNIAVMKLEEACQRKDIELHYVVELLREVRHPQQKQTIDKLEREIGRRD